MQVQVHSQKLDSHKLSVFSENKIIIQIFVFVRASIISHATAVGAIRVMEVVTVCLCSRVNDEFIIKIGDFGLTRDIYSKDYYIVNDKDRPLPVK